jgi:predicted amidophosphoribosyltransferase
MRATDILLGLCLFAVYCLVLFTDHLFRPMPPDCASCGNEMFRTTALCATCHAHHLQCWECSCGVVIADKCNNAVRETISLVRSSYRMRMLRGGFHHRPAHNELKAPSSL